MKTETPFGEGKSVIIGKVMGSVSVPVLVTKKWVGGGGEKLRKEPTVICLM